MAEPVPSGPGKTAPRLFHDLLDYDVRRVRKPKDIQNLLADNAPIHRNGKAQPRTYPNDCRHELMIQEDRSIIPQINEIPDRLTKYTVVTSCSKCLHHFTIIVDFSGMPSGGASCGLETENDLHHFRLVSLKSLSDPEYNPNDKFNTFREIHKFQCSTVVCCATLEIQIRAPRLQRNHLGLIADPAKVYQRGRRAIDADPGRYENTEALSPSQVLTVLRQYLSDALARKPAEVRRIAKRNKKFLMAFAEDCDDILRYLDFTATEETTSEGELIEYWVLPNNDNEARRAFLKDCIIELSQLVHDRPTKEQIDAKLKWTYAPVPARRHIERALGFWNYERKSRVIDIGESPKEPFYASLGVLSDFNDQMLLYSWIRQRDCDPINRPYYLDCLSQIYEERASDQLQEALIMAQSTGEYGYTECMTAFNFFGLSIEDQPEDDEHIITVYRDKVASAPRQKDEAKKCLKSIGWARNSNKIIRVSEETTMTPEDAYNFLSLGGETMNANTPSDAIEAQAIAKALDIGDGGKEDVRKALLVLADARGNDFVLRNAASTMSPDQTGVNIDEAKRLLHVKDEMTDDTVWTYYCSLKADASGAIGTQEKLASALETIANQRNSQYLMAKLKDPDSNPPIQRASATQPVGLQNIGNTCYLNSLLQYYYTVKAIREVVMNFDEHRMEMTPENISKKRVGGRAVTQSEVLKAQQFIEELRSLYQALKTVSTTYVKPTDDLAILTLFSATAEANFRRQSVSSPVLLSGKPAAVDDAVPPEGPPPSKTIPGEDVEMVDRPLEKVREAEADDASSDTTLVDTGEPQLVVNLPPPYPMPKPRNLGDSIEVDDEKMDDAVMINVHDLPTPPADELSVPERPPPVPPRNKPSDIKTTVDNDKSSREQMLKFGAQQDVTEVIGNVMFRLQCAIKPTSIDPVFGGQIDSITDTFYGSNAVYLKRASGYGVKVEPWANITVFPGKNGPRNIYEALDVHFDEQTVEIDNTTTTQFTSIRKLPPILQIQIQRTDFDRVRGAHKNQNWVSFEETIYLDRYLEPKEGETTLMERREEAWKWKAALRMMEARQKLLKDTPAQVSVPEALTATKAFLEGIMEEDPEFFDVKQETLNVIPDRVNEINDELEYLDKTITELRAKLDQQFADMTQHKYTLQAVFIHRGGLASGHYWITIYDFTKRIWREYNDEHVSELKDPDRLFKEPLQRTERDATPYYLVYVRDEDKDDLVDAVCRDVQEIEEVQETSQPLESRLQQDEAISIDDSDNDDNDAHVEHATSAPNRPIRSAADRESPEKFPEFDSNNSAWS